MVDVVVSLKQADHLCIGRKVTKKSRFQRASVSLRIQIFQLSAVLSRVHANCDRLSKPRVSLSKNLSPTVRLKTLFRLDCCIFNLV